MTPQLRDWLDIDTKKVQNQAPLSNEIELLKIIRWTLKLHFRWQFIEDLGNLTRNQEIQFIFLNLFQNAANGW